MVSGLKECEKVTVKSEKVALCPSTGQTKKDTGTGKDLHRSFDCIRRSDCLRLLFPIITTILNQKDVGMY
jgi:hypothetical protein